MTNPNDTNFSRRLLLGGSAAAIGVGLVGAGASSASAAPTAASTAQSRRSSVRSAVSFLRGVTDAYCDSGFRLAQSYMDHSGLNDIGFIYDNALTICALVAAGDLSHARAIGDGLLYAQNHDEVEEST